MFFGRHIGKDWGWPLQGLPFFAAALCAAPLVSAAPLGAADFILPAEVRKKIPPVEYTDTDGKKHEISWTAEEGRPVVFFFFEPHSSAAVLEMTFLDKISPKARDRGVEVVGIEASGLHGTELDAAMERYRRVYPQPSFPLVPDPQYELSRLFDVQEVPSTYIVGGQGTVLYRMEGFSRESQVELTKKIAKSMHLQGGEEDMAAELNPPRPPPREGGWPWEKQSPLTMLDVGDRISSFKAVDLDGKAVATDWAARDVKMHIVFFWGAMCLPCMREMTYLEEVYRSTRSQGLRVLSVQASGLTPERTALIMKRYQRFYPVPTFFF